MSQQAMKQTSETERNKVISLFRFLQELNQLKQSAILNVREHLWFFPLSSLHQDPKNIFLHFPDRVENEEPDENSIILSVKKPEFEKCPEPSHLFREWLLPGWDHYRHEAQVKDTLEDLLPGDENPPDVNQERFGDSEERVAAFEEWLVKRRSWVEKQCVTAQTRKLFTELYKFFFELQRESETEEIIAAAGMLYDRDNKEIRHPVLTRRLKLSYDSNQNIVSIEDTDASSELYTTIFQTMDSINRTAVNQWNAKLQSQDYHPFDRNETPDYLKELVHQLTSDSLFSADEPPEKWMREGRLLLAVEPCFVVRRRLDGTLKAIEQIIENIQETGEIPAPIIDISSSGIIDIPEDVPEETIEERLAAVGGESADILLSKEANREQLEIARRIERYNAVLVQGPPGTGKTHTIANLMGHFLAQGKSVLVTSHTRKALSVLKEKVAPGLRNLCVSILDDTHLDMERSVDGITDHMSRSTAFELKREMDDLEVERRNIIAELAKVRRNIFGLIHQEYEAIVWNGEGFTPAQAAAFVAERKNDLSYIPGNVPLWGPLPLSLDQFRILYQTNGLLSVSDEKELMHDIPTPTDLLSPQDFSQKLATIRKKKEHLSKIAQQKGWEIHVTEEMDTIEFSGPFERFSIPLTEESPLQQLKDHLSSFRNIEPWMKFAAVDGKKGGAFKQRWITMADQIRRTASFAESIVEEQFGKKISLQLEDTKSLRETYIKIRGFFTQKGKLSKFTLFLNKDIEPALRQASIDGHPVQNTEECDIILHQIEMSELRRQCAVYWDELLASHGVPAFSELDERTPESIAFNWLPVLERYLDWYQTEYQQLSNLLDRAVLPSDTLFSRDPLDSDLNSISKALDAVEQVIPHVCDSCLAALEIRHLTDQINASKQVLTSGTRGSSEVCRRAVDSMAAEDISAYEAAYGALVSLYNKYDFQNKRRELLNQLEPVAPLWAEAIRTRSGLHGQSTIPDNLVDAWKWKQLSEIVSEICGKPFAQLQEDSIRLSKAYREVTAKYAEKCGWYHLLKRTESNLDMKKALTGWKLTVKKIGKGTGKNAPALRAEARKLMAKCQFAVPGWIMPIHRAMESLNPKTNRFDVIIIDEASQADLSSLAIMYMGKKLIVVGDDKQVSPMAVGADADKVKALTELYIKDKIPNSHLYTPTTSIYDIASTTFQPLMLREHFRCVPEIIGFSNMLSYDYKIQPLRDASTSALLPAVVNYRVANGHRDGKVNRNEAKAIVALMRSCIQQPEYAGKTMGVISLLGDDQVKVIQEQIEEKIDPSEIVNRNILCGNSANFQGDERDVIFLSVVDSNNGIGPLGMQGFGQGEAYRKRYNVAASRGRDQLWVVDSLSPESDLKPGDIRKTLIEYSINPHATEIRNEEIQKKAESPFEVHVAQALSSRGYHLVQQWKVGGYRLDMVAVCGKKTAVIECDGDRFHSGEEKIREDMERQAILERLGWRFIRIRGSEYYRQPEETLERVIHELDRYEIHPEDAEQLLPENRNTELLQRVKSQAEQLLLEEDGEPTEIFEITIAGALDPTKLTRDLPATPEVPISKPERKPKVQKTSGKTKPTGTGSTTKPKTPQKEPKTAAGPALEQLVLPGMEKLSAD